MEQTERNFRIAVKAFIVQDGKVLLIKRRPNDSHKPGTWDIPGGRLEFGENPLTGVKREASEEVGLNVEPIMPIDIHHFTRDDGQEITMIIFWCKSDSTHIALSEEHTDFSWKDLKDSIEHFPDWLQPVVTKFNQHIKLS